VAGRPSSVYGFVFGTPSASHASGIKMRRLESGFGRSCLEDSEVLGVLFTPAGSGREFPGFGVASSV
jgi:hypothetical protein